MGKNWLKVKPKCTKQDDQTLVPSLHFQPTYFSLLLNSSIYSPPTLSPIKSTPFPLSRSLVASSRSKFKSRLPVHHQDTPQFIHYLCTKAQFSSTLRTVSERASRPSTLCKHYTDAPWNLSKQCTHQSNAPTTPSACHHRGRPHGGNRSRLVHVHAGGGCKYITIRMLEKIQIEDG